jgi:hypothetical protein
MKLTSKAARRSITWRRSRAANHKREMQNGIRQADVGFQEDEPLGGMFGLRSRH